MGLITLVQPNETFWVLVAADDNDPTDIRHKISQDEPTDKELADWSALKCRRVSPDWLEDLKRQFTKWATDRSGRYEETNWKAYRHAAMKYILEDWKGMTGSPPCTDENKLMLPTSIQVLVIGQSSGVVTLPDRGELQKNS